MNFFSLTHNRLLILLIIGLNVLAACNSSQTGLLRDPGGVASDSAPHGLGSHILSSYSGSYALLIGESQYTNGWDSLVSIPEELRDVEKLLKSQNFKVEKSMNLNADQLGNRFKTFINDYGFDENNRLLFFYSGHGHTRKNKGYLVPTDAPNPHFDEKGFLQKAVTMSEILAMARRMDAKHALFLFDSCFSGTVFKEKALPKMPRQISKMARLPVRQFITAGSADETVPAKSVFTPAFVDALRYGLGDLYKDGYVTGEELGLYLKNKVPEHTDQTPQYGKIRDYDLSRGDFVFVVAGGNQDVAQLSTPAPVAPVPASIPVLRPVPVVSTHSSYRYTDNGNGTVTDNRSGLMWLKNANCFGLQRWSKAKQSAANLASGQCGLSDGSRRGMWRLPTYEEWNAMIDEKYIDRENYSRPALSNAAGTGPWKEGDAFSGVQTYYYWSSTTLANSTTKAWYVYFANGHVGYDNKTRTNYVWPVRGGQ